MKHSPRKVEKSLNKHMHIFRHYILRCVEEFEFVAAGGGAGARPGVHTQSFVNELITLQQKSGRCQQRLRGAIRQRQVLQIIYFCCLDISSLNLSLLRKRLSFFQDAGHWGTFCEKCFHRLNARIVVFGSISLCMCTMMGIFLEIFCVFFCALVAGKMLFSLSIMF
jgi:hypothetical protein